MDSLAGYGSDEENETERYYNHQSGSSGAHGAHRRRDDDTNYDDVNMDLSEDSGTESEPELPPVEPAAPPPAQHAQHDRNNSNESRDRDRDRDRDLHRDRDRDREAEKRGWRRDPSPRPRADRDRDRRPSPPPRRDDRYRGERERERERGRGGHEGGAARRGLLGDRPDDRHADSAKPPSLMDLKPFGNEGPPPHPRSSDARDAVSPRFVDKERDRARERDRDSRRDDRGRERDRDGDRGRGREEERGRERDRRDRYEDDRRSSSRPDRERERSRSRPGAAYPPPSSSSERRGSPPSGDYRPSSYKVNKKLEVMEKMGLQIKTPDGSMATAQQLRAAAGEPAPRATALPSYYNPTAVNTNKILDQVQKRKLLWSNKNKREAEEAAKWSGTRFAQDADGKQVSKFMRLMGIKEPAAVKPEPTEKTADPIKKQEELFQAMQQQYEVARATTHTMRGVGLGFQRGGQL